MNGHLLEKKTSDMAYGSEMDINKYSTHGQQLWWTFLQSGLLF